jgi:YHS domain-containing protein
MLVKFLKTKISNRTFLLISAAIGTAVFFAACSKSEGVKAVNVTSNNVAVKGYDTVAFFTENKPVEGKADFQHSWNGATWNFSSEANRDSFAKNPEKYAPQYGGYCSYAVSHGYTADGDPQAWKIVDGKLYLNYNQKAKEAWETDIPNNIKNGNENWKTFLKKKPEHKG